MDDFPCWFSQQSGECKRQEMCLRKYFNEMIPKPPFFVACVCLPCFGEDRLGKSSRGVCYLACSAIVETWPSWAVGRQTKNIKKRNVTGECEFLLCTAPKKRGTLPLSSWLMPGSTTNRRPRFIHTILQTLQINQRTHFTTVSKVLVRELLATAMNVIRTPYIKSLNGRKI